VASVFGRDEQEGFKVIRFLIPIQTVSEANRRDHWAEKAKRAKLHRMTARICCPGADLPCLVTMTRCSPRALDDDNLRSALKHARDGIADKLGVDDRDPRVEWKYAQRQVKKNASEIGVLVEICPQ
jgi:hypothetical protein